MVSMCCTPNTCCAFASFSLLRPPTRRRRRALPGGSGCPKCAIRSSEDLSTYVPRACPVMARLAFCPCLQSVDGGAGRRTILHYGQLRGASCLIALPHTGRFFCFPLRGRPPLLIARARRCDDAHVVPMGVRIGAAAAAAVPRRRLSPQRVDGDRPTMCAPGPCKMSSTVLAAISDSPPTPPPTHRPKCACGPSARPATACPPRGASPHSRDPAEAPPAAAALALAAAASTAWAPRRRPERRRRRRRRSSAPPPFGRRDHRAPTTRAAAMTAAPACRRRGWRRGGTGGAGAGGCWPGGRVGVMSSSSRCVW